MDTWSRIRWNIRKNKKCLTIDDAIGHVAMLYKLKLVESLITIVTIGFNVETVEYENMLFAACDVDGGDKICSLLRHNYQNIQGIVFVVNTNGCEGMDGAKEELSRIVTHDELTNTILLIFANKQDSPNAMSVNEATERLDLNQFATLILIVFIHIKTMDNFVDICSTFQSNNHKLNSD